MKFGPPLSKVKPGDSYRASDQNKIVDAVNQAGRFAVDGATAYSLASGQYLFVPSEDWCFASLTASDGSNAYTWAEQYPAPGGGWTDGARSGGPASDPAREANGIEADPTLFPFRAVLRRAAASGEWIFFLDQCQT